jgi:hypothetical protein
VIQQRQRTSRLLIVLIYFDLFWIRSSFFLILLLLPHFGRKWCTNGGWCVHASLGMCMCMHVSGHGSHGHTSEVPHVIPFKWNCPISRL